MSVFNRMAAIEKKIAQLDSKLEGGRAGFQSNAGQANLTSGAPAGNEGVTFESLVNTLADDQRYDARSGPAKLNANRWNGDPKDFDGMIAEASKKHGVDQALIRSVIKQESGYNPKATSYVGAQGLMQLMPETAAGLGVSDSYDPYQNIMGGTLYLRQLMDRFDGNLTKVIAGYNAGPGAVEKHGGVPPYQETQDYVAKVLDNYRYYSSNNGHSI